MTALPLGVAAVGFLFGFRHAFEPDHLAAVSTLASRQGSVRAAARLGLAWAAGHTASVAVVALALILAGWRLPAAVQPFGDLVVSGLLVALGLNALARLARGHRAALGAAHARAHRRHVPHVHLPPARDARGALGFGLAHGLAGSGAVVLLMVAAAASTGAQLAYLLAFGLGTAAGMLGVSSLLALALRASGHARGIAILPVGAAVVSIVVGLRLGVKCLATLG